MIKLYSILVRKAIDYEHLLEGQKNLIYKFHTHPEEFKIETIVEVSHEEFETFKSNMLYDYDFIKGVNEIFLLKESGTSDISGIIIDAQGSNYAHYSGIPMQRCDIRKCPRCSRYFAELPATSRKDNKTEICSNCGMEEALESYGIEKGMIDFFKIVQKTADQYNTKITIEISDHNDIVIVPKK